MQKEIGKEETLKKVVNLEISRTCQSRCCQENEIPKENAAKLPILFSFKLNVFGKKNPKFPLFCSKRT